MELRPSLGYLGPQSLTEALKMKAQNMILLNKRARAPEGPDIYHVIIKVLGLKDHIRGGFETLIPK